MENFDGEGPIWARECSVGKVPVALKWKANLIQMKCGPGIVDIGSNLRWIKLRGESVEQCKNTCCSLWLVFEGVIEFFVHGCSEV